jgi:hypothetical protein
MKDKTQNIDIASVKTKESKLSLFMILWLLFKYRKDRKKIII